MLFVKKLFALFLLSIVFQGAINAQRTRSEIQKMAIMLPSVDPAMTKEQRYKVVLPENISKLADDITPAAGGFFARNDMRINLASKQIGRKNVEDFDIIFEVVSSGMSRFHMTDPYKQKIAGIETYISEMYFSFPFTLLIKDRDGKLLRTVDISSGDDVFTMQYHAQFLRKLDLDTPKKPFAGFNSIKEFNESIEKIDLIKLRVAKNQLKVLFDLCSRVINTNYAGVQKKGNLVFITKLLDESPSGIYSDLLLAIETQKQALTEVYNAESQQNLVQLLKPAITTYEKYLTKEGTDEKIKRLCYHNLFNCYFYSGEFDKAVECYKDFLEIYDYDFLGVNELAEFDRIFTYHQLKQSQHSYIPNVIAQVQNSLEDSKNQKEQIKQDRESRATREQEKEVAERIERLRINEPGFLIDKGGKKYQGIVITKLADPSIFTGATVRVVTEERVKDFWIRSVQMLHVSSGDYYPIKIDLDSLLVRRTFLMKSIFHGQQASLFENPADESYVIKEKDEDIGYEVKSILISAKSANAFWDKYLAIKDKVNELKLDDMKKEDCRTLMNLMATCDK